MKPLLALLLVFSLGCGVDREQPALLVWVPGGGPPAARIRQLVDEMGLAAAVVTDRELLSLRPQVLKGVKVAVCFDGPGAQTLTSTVLAALPRQGGILMAAGPAAAALGPAWNFTARTTSDPVLRWAPAVWPRLAPGTYDPANGAALTYGYGPKLLSGWDLETPEGEVWARDPQGRVRWLERRTPSGGRLVLAGLPLAAEAEAGDGLQARLFLERAAELAGLPRLWPTPEGKGAVLINVHVDSKAHLPYLKDLVAQWPARVKGTFHFTAGPDNEREGDGQGFNVLDPALGGAWVGRLAALGEVGPHGGWIHNAWALRGKDLTSAQRQELLKLNFDAMARWSAPHTYSSPGGYHPRDLNPWLEAHGVRGYYHTGEAGSPPTHAWLDGTPFAHSMWAFPVATLGANAATYEFKQHGVPEAQVQAWFLSLAEFCRQRREVRMVYGHAVDFGDMPAAYGALLKTLDAAVAAGTLNTFTLAEYAAFLDRRQQVRWTVTPQGRGQLLRAHGPLRGMAFQLPGSWQGSPDPGLALTREAGATWIVVTDARQDLEFKLWP